MHTVKGKYTIPLFELDALQGPMNIRTLAESFHKTLHRHLPCQLENGTLGECIGAWLLKEPQWIINGNRDSSFFFLLLTG